MTNYLRVITLTATVLFLSVSAVAQDRQPTPEERAYKFRTSLFQTFAWKMGQLARAKAAGDKNAFDQHANDLSYLSRMIEEGFSIPDSLPDGTKAKPEIWEDFDTFKAKIQNLAERSKGLTENGAMADFDPREFGSKACGACHRDFKVKD